VRERVGHSTEKYSVHYLHVTRADEWDFRKLHAEWLAETLAENRASIGFEDFRHTAEKVVASLELKPTPALLL
jgi:hypothetical protein